MTKNKDLNQVKAIYRNLRSSPRKINNILNEEKKGNSFSLYLTSDFNKFNFNFNTKSGSDYYSGFYRGRNTSQGVLNYKYNSQNSFYLSYFNNKYRPVNVSTDNSIDRKFTINQIKRELMNAKSIEEALLQMLLKKRPKKQ